MTLSLAFGLSQPLSPLDRDDDESAAAARISSGPTPQKARTMSLTATELKVARLFGYTPEEFSKEKARLAALDARDAQIETLNDVPSPRPVSSSELSATDLKVIRLTGVSAEDFLKERARLAALDARDNDLARMVEE